MENDKIEYINELIQHKYTSTRKESIVKQNFYSLMTIAIMAVAILLYSKYVLPAYKQKEQIELKKQKRDEYILKRKKQIALSHKLNGQNGK